MSTQLRIVGTFSYVDGKFVSIDTNRKDFNDGRAIPISVAQIQNYYPLKAQSSITVGGLLNSLALTGHRSLKCRKTSDNKRATKQSRKNPTHFRKNGSGNESIANLRYSRWFKNL